MHSISVLLVIAAMEGAVLLAEAGELRLTASPDGSIEIVQLEQDILPSCVMAYRVPGESGRLIPLLVDINDAGAVPEADVPVYRITLRTPDWVTFAVREVARRKGETSEVLFQDPHAKP